MSYPICVFIRFALKGAFAKGVPLENEKFFSYFLFLGFLASVGSPYENFSSPFCEITFQKRNTQIGWIRKSDTT